MNNFKAAIGKTLLGVLVTGMSLFFASGLLIQAKPETAPRSMKIARYEGFGDFQTEAYHLFRSHWEVSEITHNYTPQGYDDIIVVYVKNQ